MSEELKDDKARATLEDIAKAVGVDKSTVSATLRDIPRAQRFRPKLRARIFEVARQLDYQPNFFASQLRSAQKKIILLCLSYLQDSVTAEIVESFEKRAEGRGYRILVSIFQNKEDPFQNNRQVLGTHGCAGMAVIGASREKLSDKTLKSLADEGQSIVLVGRDIDDERIARVLVDDFTGGQMAARYFYEQSIKRIWILSGPADNPKFVLRSRGVCQFLESVGAAPPEIINSPVVSGNRSSAGYDVFREHLRGAKPPEGVIALSDMLAYGAFRALAEAGLRVGEDVAVIGYDDIWPSEFFTPPLTTLRQPMRRMGAIAADMLIDKLEDSVRVGEKVTFTPELVVRRSGLISALTSH